MIEILKLCIVKKHSENLQEHYKIKQSGLVKNFKYFVINYC
jgi:hypothetical protein